MHENYTPAQIIDKEIEISDALENLVAQLGTEQDKRASSKFRSKRNSHQDKNELEALYREDWLAGKIVDIIPDDMTREWRLFDGDIDPREVELLENEEKRLDLIGCFNRADKWSRLYGTSLIVMDIDDGQQPDQPLDLDFISVGDLRHIKVVDCQRFDISDISITYNPLDPNYGYPELYTFSGSGVRVHHSRVIRFDAIELPFEEFIRNNYVSDSILTRLYEALTNFHTVTDATASMIYESNVDIVKIKNLMNYVSTDEGRALVTKRFTLAGMLKSFNNTLLLDTDEEHSTKTNTFTSLPEIMDRYGLFVTGGSDIPAVRLMGSSATGLSATGEGDLKNYYDKIKSDQTRRYRPKLDVIDKIMARNVGISEEADLSYSFNSLFQMTPKEIADQQLVDAQRDQIYLSNNIIDELVVAKELKQNSTYTNITDENIEDLEKILKEINNSPEKQNKEDDEDDLDEA